MSIFVLFFHQHLWAFFQHPTTLDTSFNSITDLVFVICKFFPIKMCYFKLSCFSPSNSCKRIKRGTHFKILSKALECAAHFWTLYSTRPFSISVILPVSIILLIYSISPQCSMVSMFLEIIANLEALFFIPLRHIT